jgi:ssDNA-binding Zn-finger/Zn-ribbon topoisomerase 1
MTDDIKCPKCGSQTTIRTAKKGADAGEKFHVCNRYPDCKGKVSMGMSEEDAAILNQFLDNGTPCIPFIPIDALEQSLSIVKHEGLTGFFIARIPTLYADGSIKHLYKEEFMLYKATRGLTSNSKKKGSIYSFLGFELPMTDIWEGKYLSTQMFYQNNLSLFRMNFQEEIKFFRQIHAPSLEVALIPANHNLKVKNVCVVNFLKVTQILLNDKEATSEIIMSPEAWNTLKLPSSGQDLQEMFSHHIASIREELSR